MKFPAQFWKKSLIGLVTMLATPTVVMAKPTLFADGIYLFGQSPEPEQIGQEYLIFRVQQGKMVGAIYLPQSEFSCFSGTITPPEVNLAIRDPYENQLYRHSIALKPLAPVAADQPIAQKMGLEGYYSIATINDSAQGILQTCLDTLRN
jgi:hypothetical protein